ncbi:MAG: PH domain-containing protein [Anaerolineae bacterium]|jgi:hypothetical protein|nr:PH domain-containing protein [Anaerolineae bacterium]
MSEQPISSEIQNLVQDEQDVGVVQKVHTRILELLTHGEELRYIAVQKKPVINVFPMCIVLTTRRFIIYKPELMGQAQFEDYIWRDLKDVDLKEDVIGSTVTLHTVDEKELSVGFLPKTQARRIYAIAQEMEEEMLEERRRRDMEEKRAAAGGIYMPGSNTATAASREDPVEALKQLKRLLDAGLITQQEYDVKKEEILLRM